MTGAFILEEHELCFQHGKLSYDASSLAARCVSKHYLSNLNQVGGM